MWRAIATYLFLVVAAAFSIAPIVLGVLTAFKSPAQFATESALAMPAPWTLDNFVTILGGRIRFADALFTTTAAAIFLVAIQVPLSIMAAYAFACLTFPGARRAVLGVPRDADDPGASCSSSRST